MPYIRKTKDIFISEKLKSVLYQFSNRSSIAASILRGRIRIDQLIENPVNYLSVSNADDQKISYLTQDRIKDIEPDQYWSSGKRYQTKPGAILNKIFKNVNPKDVEEFSNLYKLALEEDKLHFEIVEGEDIIKWYNGENYARQSSSLGMSCMKHNQCQEYIKFYSVNPKQVKMLILLNNDGDLVGRSLLWDVNCLEVNEQKSPEGLTQKIMDRIYTIDDDRYTYKFKSWADTNGYWYKMEQKWNNSILFEHLNNRFTAKLSTKLDYAHVDMFPYLDTFKFLNINNGIIHNFIPDHQDIRTLISCEGGTYPADSLAFDDIDQNLYWRETMIHLEYCNLLVRSDITCFSDINGIAQLRDHSIYDDEIRSFIFNEEYNRLNNKERIENARKKRSNHTWKTHQHIDVDLFSLNVEPSPWVRTEPIDLIVPTL